MNLKLYSFLFALFAGPSLLFSQEILTTSLAIHELEKKKSEIILLQNQGDLIPLEDLGGKKIVHLSLAPKGKDYFQESLGLYSSSYYLRLKYEELYQRKERIMEICQEADLLVLSLHNLINYSGLSKKIKLGLLDLWKDLFAQHQSLVVFFGSESELAKFPMLKQGTSLLFSPSEHPVNQEYCSQIIYGALSAEGRLRQDIGSMFHKGNGLRSSENLRLSYGPAETVGWSGERLTKKIDSLIYMGIDSQAFPGCQVLVAKNKQVIFHKAYGHHTYDKRRKVKLTDVYDLASVTKISAALPALMFLKDEEKIQMDLPLSRYWPDWAKSNKKTLGLKEILAHQAGLTPYIVFYQKALKKNGNLKRSIFRQEPSETFSEQVYKDLYLNRKYRKKMYKSVRKSAVEPRGSYKYSGLSFLIYPELVQNLTGQSFEALLEESFYNKLGASSLGFNPWKERSLDEIIPTEYDSTFRKSLVHGYVHDEAAAMMGGVSGNAGLFSNANDLAKLMQMYLDMGTYGGERYIDAETLKEFSSYAYAPESNRRGLGFDKPEKDGYSYIAKDASKRSFGHSGFTGTFTWADPTYNLVFVFLSNRVYPSRTNRNLYKLKLRENLHQALYDEIHSIHK